MVYVSRNGTLSKHRPRNSDELAGCGLVRESQRLVVYIKNLQGRLTKTIFHMDELKIGRHEGSAIFVPEGCEIDKIDIITPGEDYSHEGI